MIIDMLEAVSEILALSLGEKRDANDPNVRCAKVMLDKIIEGMKREDSLTIVGSRIPDVKLNPPTKFKPPKSDQYAIIPNDDGSIRDILDPSGVSTRVGKIELDGKEYTFQEAIGMKFQSGRIL